MKALVLFTTSFVFALSLFSGCSTNPYRNYEDVKIGMDKTEVLEQVGSPRESFRKKGKDVWVYVFYDEHKKVLKEVQFDDGHVTYTGDPQVSKKKKIVRKKEVPMVTKAEKAQADAAKKPKVWPPPKEEQDEEVEVVVPQFEPVN